MSKTYQIYGIGNALVDKEFEVTDEFFSESGVEKGLMTLIEEDKQESLLQLLIDRFGLKKRACGGSAANTIIAAQYFGSQTFYSCNVANDETGDFFMSDLKGAGVHSNLGEDRPSGTTGKCLVMITPDAERTMNTFLGITADLDESHLVEPKLADSEFLYIEGYLVTSDTAREAAKKAKAMAIKNNVKVAMTFSDPAMVQYFKDQVADVVGEGVDLLFCNETEAMLWADTDNLDDAIVEIKKIAKQFAITLGSDGALLFDGENEFKIAPHEVKAVDSNGAGDMFAGAFLHGITSGKSFEEAGKLASLASATVVSQFGPRLRQEQHSPIKAKVFG